MNIRTAVHGFILVEIVIEIVVGDLLCLHYGIVNDSIVNLNPTYHIRVSAGIHIGSIVLRASAACADVSTTAANRCVIRIRIDGRFGRCRRCAFLRTRNSFGYGFIHLLVVVGFHLVFDVKKSANAADGNQHRKTDNKNFLFHNGRPFFMLPCLRPAWWSSACRAWCSWGIYLRTVQGSFRP